jgi:hypothetical protein
MRHVFAMGVNLHIRKEGTLEHLPSLSQLFPSPSCRLVLNCSHRQGDAQIEDKTVFLQLQYVLVQGVPFLITLSFV